MKTAYMNAPTPWPGAAYAPTGGCCAAPHHHCDCDSRPHYHAFCQQCCHPAAACCCGDRHCHKEAKELLVEGKAIGKEDVGNLAGAEIAMADHVLKTVRLMRSPLSTGARAPATKADLAANPMEALAVTPKATAGTASAFIGGGCCVHLSVEYMPDNPLAPAQGAVVIAVSDSDKTVMMWAKVVEADAGYRIQEDIITTHPGAVLAVRVVQAVARVRWCEVFSC